MPMPSARSNAEKQQIKVPELDPKKVYTVIGTGASKHIKEGDEYSVSGGDAMILIGRGAVTLKPDA